MNYFLSCAPSGVREPYLPLLLLADESQQQVLSYIESGDLYVFTAGSDVHGITLAIPVEPGVVELKAVAIAREVQRQGIGTRMLEQVLSELRNRGIERAIVGTSNAAIGQLAFYQKIGFRMLRVERDFFSPARGYAFDLTESGIRMRDMVWMDMSLRAKDLSHSSILKS